MLVKLESGVAISVRHKSWMKQILKGRLNKSVESYRKNTCLQTESYWFGLVTTER